ncbi:MAG: ABC transporter substrate-binding protein [Sphaerobacter sp.]|nr:ABC transporter substrate-binding protein [Sphaerobacter sp.]
MTECDERRDATQWGALLSAPLNRRRLMRFAAGAAVAGSAMSMLAACGGDSDEPSSSGGQKTGGPSGSASATPSSGASGSSGSAGDKSTPKPGGRLIIGRSGDSDSLDPQHTIAGISWQVFQHIYDPLIGKTLDLEYEGVLAESWEISEDGKEITFKIRKGIKFHDGTDLTPEAVAFSFNRLIDPATNAPAAAWVTPLQKAEAIDDSTVTMTLSEAFSPFLGNISSAYFGILSPAAVEKYGADFGQHPVGTGPYKFKEWVAGQTITLERNPDYKNFRSIAENKGPAYFDEIVFRNIPEEQTQIASFETGEINMLLTVPPHQVKKLESNPDVQLLPTETATNIYFLEFHTLKPEGEYGFVVKPPFDDLRVRQAVAYAINADEIIKAVLDGRATRNYGPMPTGNYGYNPEIKQYGYDYDPEKAKQLLEEAGWKASGNGPRQKDGQPLQVVLWTSNATTNQRICQVIQNQLNQVGFDVQIEAMEVATLLARLGTPDDTSHFDFMSWGWTEPDLLYMMTDSDSGVGLYRSEEYRKYVTEARRVNDLDERAKLYFEAMKVMLKDVPIVPLWTQNVVVGVRKEIKGIKLDAQGYPIYHDGYFES